MIVLDANVLIAYLDNADQHHGDAMAFLDRYASQDLRANVLTVAEALVYPTLTERQEAAAAAFASIGLQTVGLDPRDSAPLARIRAHYRVRMPDAVVLHTAVSLGAYLKTYDRALAQAADEAGVTLLSH